MYDKLSLQLTIRLTKCHTFDRLNSVPECAIHYLCLYICQLFTKFCHTIYAVGAIEATGSKKLSDIHTARIVFFCPIDCPRVTLSPTILPTARPNPYCERQITRATTANAISTHRLASVSRIKQVVRPSTKISDISHR